MSLMARSDIRTCHLSGRYRMLSRPIQRVQLHNRLLSQRPNWLCASSAARARISPEQGRIVINRRDFIYAASAGAASAAASPVATFAQNNPAAAPDVRQSAVKLRTITLEEHFATPAFATGPGKGLVERLRSSGPRGIKIAEQLLDVGDGRVAEMDAGDIDVQVLSLNAPGVEQVADPAEQTAIAREANDFVFDVVKKYPKRFAAFAAFPFPLPSWRPMSWSSGSASRASRAR